ncbi:MAG: Orotidine 5'-phosphate decarboxylase [Parcubacteria group bacterium GW2011_GWC2_42_12]|uniref:Orotidine 5'-phosphate decarboxylase n=1 Tax=Candidatus Falkowbacteria bacterium RIFCSPHIGHO2_02_FULL_42_9 TaxID=1797986 RepID=A0A1F5S7D4_9BACT|nr:MAG: Orotidine 5'-phosphate decarboxylase [Parcubacteria group bacterium GW2011_GWC2_42_12]OGF22614.1 MAG: orotidine 5'-phosphate decarboxylase [Candidatus Falkowbacteria bacterium RIFCSPHIGHO2_02_FULL_42_9]
MESPVIAALDVPTTKEALELVEALSGAVGAFKINHQLFVSAGPEVVGRIHEKSERVLLDLEFNGTPNTVVEAVKAATRHRIWALTIHIGGDLKMMKAAKAAAQTAGQKSGVCPLVVGVAVLTSSDDDILHAHGIPSTTTDLVRRMTGLAMRAGLDALICPPQEVAAVRNLVPREVQLMVPGIRSLGEDKHGHKQTRTPKEAVEGGANWLIIGRPIYAAKNPRQAAEQILATLA